MALTNTQRQAKYWQQIKSGERKRFQFTLPLDVGIKADYLCAALQCNKTELYSEPQFPLIHKHMKVVVLVSLFIQRVIQFLHHGLLLRSHPFTPLAGLIVLEYLRSRSTLLWMCLYPFSR
jgi:hypothetical protein